MSLSGTEQLQPDLLQDIEALLRRKGIFIPDWCHLEKCVLTFGPLKRASDPEKNTGQRVEIVMAQDSVDSPKSTIDRAGSIDWHADSVSAHHTRDPTVYQDVNDHESQPSDASTITPDTHTFGIPFNLPIRSIESSIPSSAKVKKPRNIHQRADGLTDACGVYSPAQSGQPVAVTSKVKTANRFCPRCLSNMTRTRSVKDHFPLCIAKYGNPMRLKYTDHPSLVGAEKQRKNAMKALCDRNYVDRDDDEDTTKGETRMESWVDEQVAIKTEFENTLSTQMEDMPSYEASRSSPSHLGDGLSDFMNRYPDRETVVSSSSFASSEIMELS